jgi:hypothetical protein
MAILGSTTLTGCGFIPDFIGSGSRMIFHQTNAPINWTKITTGINDMAIRIIGGVNGTGLTPGGQQSFSTIFTANKASPFLTNPSTIHPGTSTTGSTAGYIVVGQGDTSFATTTNALPNNTMRAHSHTLQVYVNLSNVTGSPTTRLPSTTRNITVPTLGINPRGNQLGHNHGVNNVQHVHGYTGAAHSHPLTSPGHQHQVTMTGRDFSVTYVDVIVCSKD